MSARELVSGGSWYKWLDGQRIGACAKEGGMGHTGPFSSFQAEPSSLSEKSSHKGNNVFPFNLKNYRRREERVSSSKLGASLAWLVALPINIGLPGLETQRSGLLGAIGEHPSWSSVRELTAAHTLHASA